MQYLGGKFRISKPLSEFLNQQMTEDDTFVDLFCGSLNITVNVKSKNIILNDKHRYLMSMWRKCLEGWIPPTSVTEEEYQQIKQNPNLYDPALVGFVGFACSFSGKWWGGYCRNSRGRNYAKDGSNSILKKIGKLKDKTILPLNLDYSEVEIPPNAIVYCDIPYNDSTSYSKKETGIFDHDLFYDWARKTSKEKSCKIFVSEYLKNIPDDLNIVWEYKSKKDIRNKKGELEETIEVLIRI
jgi:DNA adenine methylase